jgi:GT2 family glycosyltransferase
VSPGPDVAILVLNWNGADLLRRHLPAAVACAEASRTATKVYVVDNGSTDDSREVVADLGGVEWLGFPDNRKLVAYNDAARAIDCTAFVALNNDLSPPAHAVDALWETLHSADDVFAVGGLMRDATTGQVESGPTDARWEGEWVVEPSGLAGANGPIDVAYVSGGAALYRRDRFLDLEGFWAVLPSMYWEDVDLGLRAWMHGWRSVFRPDVEFAHESGATVKRTMSVRRRSFGVYRNRRLIHAALLLDGSDLRSYVRAELRRSLRKPYYWPSALTLVPRLPAALRRRRELRRRCGPITVAELQRRWGEARGD